MRTPTAGPKTKRGATTVGGAIAIIIGWLVGDVAGYEMPDYVLQAWTVVVMAIISEWSRDDEILPRSSISNTSGRVREPSDTDG